MVQPQTPTCRCPTETCFLLSLPFGSFPTLVQPLLHGILSQQQPWPAHFSRQIYPCQHPSLECQLLPRLKGCVEALKTKTREGTVPRPHTKKSDFFLLHFNQRQSYRVTVYSSRRHFRQKWGLLKISMCPFISTNSSSSLQPYYTLEVCYSSLDEPNMFLGCEYTNP